MLQGFHSGMWEVKARCRQRELQYLGNMPLLGPVGGVLWGSQAKARLVSSNQNSGVLVSSSGVLSKGRRGRQLITKAIGEVISGT